MKRTKDSKDYKEYISLPLYNRILLFSELRGNDNLLFIYDRNTEKFRPFQSFIRIGIENREFCLHLHQNHSKGYTLGNFIEEFSNKGVYHRIPLKQDSQGLLDLASTAVEVDAKVNDIEKGRFSGTRLLADYGDLVRNPNLLSHLLEWEGSLRKKLSAVGPITVIGAYDADSLQTDMMGTLAKAHRKVLVSAHSETTFYLPEFSAVAREAETAPSLNLISKDVADEYVKASMETILLSMLKDDAMCGYDLLKEIYQKFGVLLSQGTIYPLLHHLEERGLLKSETPPNTRGKVYSPTDSGKELIEKRVAEFLHMQNYVAHFLSK